jgi:hypothetical protein
MRKFIVTTALIAGFMASTAHAVDIELQDNPPERYVVVKGDTLWDIAGHFLKKPWRWPEIWGMNKEQIKDPHWIYPGDVIVLDMSGESARLRLLKGEKYEGQQPAEITKLSPSVRIEPLRAGAIPSISPSAIEPFLSKPLITDEAGLDGSPYIISAEEDRVLMGSGSKAYVRGLKAGDGRYWQIYRPGKALTDPDTKEILGHEAVYLGDATVTRSGDPATIEITKAVLEMNRGDRLVLPPQETFTAYIPHAPEKPIKGRIISVYGAVAEGGQNAIVTLNKGNRDGVTNGTVLAIYRHGSAVKPMFSEKVDVLLPDEQYGLVFVFRTFDKLSYALVVQTNRAVHVLDDVQNP